MGRSVTGTFTLRKPSNGGTDTRHPSAQPFDCVGVMLSASVSLSGVAFLSARLAQNL